MDRKAELQARLASLGPGKAADLLHRILNPAWCAVTTCDQPDQVQCPSCVHFVEDPDLLVEVK